MLSEEEHEAVHRRAEELGISLRVLVVCSILGISASVDGVIEKVLDHEFRLRALELEVEEDPLS